MKASDFIKLVDEENGSAPVAPEVPVAPVVPTPAPMPMADAPSAADFIRTFDIENDQRIADNGTTWDSVKDKGASLVAGAPALGKAVYDILRMATGDADWTVYGSNKYEQWRKDAIDALMSDAGKAKRRILERPLNDPNAGVSDVFTTALANPDAAVNMAVESMPTMLASAFGGGGTALAAKTGAKLLGKELSKQALAKAATAGSIGTSAAMNAGDTFTSDAVQDLPMANRYQGAALSAALSAAAGKLLDGGAEGILARNMAGQGSKSGLVRGVLGGMAKEGGQEFIEEGGNAAGEQLAKREFKPNDILKRGTLGGMVGAIMGGPVGGLEGASSRSQMASNTQQGTPTSSTLDALKVGSDTPVEPTQSERLVRPDAKIAKSNDSIVGEARRVGEAQVLPGSDRVVRVQNRDRSSDASVAQMTEIAAHLDYGRLSPGRDFGNGAPVVAYGNVDEAHRGKTDYAVTADGERIPVQYAVVEATDVLTSNDASGNRVTEYQSAGPERMRAIAGNGRIAGVQRAYERGTAAKYRDEMTADYESFGVDPAVIEQMKAPVLVRIMPEDKIRTDVGSISNTSMNMDMSIVEKANDDAANIDFSTLEFDENGNPTDETVRQFVGRFPAGQAAGMMTGDGTISQQAKARFGAALFKKAYDNDQLTAIYAESTEGEAKNILNALAAVAGKMVRLEGGGDLDLRPIVAEAAEIIINARREGKTVAQYVADGSLGQSAEAAIVAEALDANKRSGKEMRRILSQAADDAFEAMSGQDLLIGEAKTREGIFDNIRGEIDAKKHQEQQSSDNQSAEAKHVEERGGTSTAESNVQREAVEPAGQAEPTQTSASEQEVKQEPTEQESDTKPEQEQAEAAEENPNSEFKFSRRKAPSKEDSQEEAVEQDDVIEPEAGLPPRMLNRKLSNFNEAEQRAWDEYLESIPKEEANSFLDKIHKLANTPWAEQAIEAVFVRQAIRRLVEGKDVDFESALDSTATRQDCSDMKRAVSGGVEGLKRYFVRRHIFSHTSKARDAVNGSFRSCRPSSECAKYCYATKFLYRGAQKVVLSELIDFMVEHEPDWMAERSEKEFMTTSDFYLGKALRLFDKGDGNEHWIPYIEALNRRNIPVQVFSKRPEFLRKVPSMNVRLLSVDQSNFDLALKNLDLPMAFVYGDISQIHMVKRLIEEGALRVVLPVKIGNRTLDQRDKPAMDALRSLAGINGRICPVDGGKVKLAKSGHEPVKIDGEWCCYFCNSGGGVGCFKGHTTVPMVKKLQQIEAEYNLVLERIAATNEDIFELEEELYRLEEEYEQGFDGGESTAIEADGSNSGRSAESDEQRSGMLERVNRSLDARRQALRALIDDRKQIKARRGFLRSSRRDADWHDSDGQGRRVIPIQPERKPGNEIDRKGESGDRKESLKFSRAQEDWTPDNDLIERAKETFGVTRDVREAFYVLPDGTMLDGSGRHWGGDERDVAGQRQVDHQDINEVLDSGASGSEAMYEWMAKTGAMRVDFESGIASIARKPTRDQLSVLARASRGKYLALSFNTPEGRIVDDTEFESASAAKIQDFFDRALDMAARGVAGAFASKGSKKRGAQDAKTIVKTLEGDSDVGGAFNRLNSLGTVVVVSTTDNLPKRIRQALDQTKASTGIVTKHSDNGAIQGLYDTKNRVAYIIASNVTPETAKAVFLHEVGVHMGMDVMDDMKSLAMRARNMVNNGAKQGDATAMEVKRRMVDAGILSDVNEDIKPADAEEAFAYLVEVAAYADSRSPFRKWLDSVIARVKRWLNDHGIKLSIKPHEFVEIALGNANALAGLKGRQLNAKETFKKSVIGKSVEKHLGGDWGKAIQLDATGRKKFAWGEHALVGGTNVALDVLEAAIPALRTTYSIRYARPEVRRMIRDYAARCDAAVQEAGGVAKEMMKWSSADRELLSDTIEGMLKTGTLPPQHVVEAAAKMSHLMTRQAQELVELGMLSEKSAARWRGHYLPRFYKERDPLFGEDWFKNLFKRSSTIRGVGGGSLKGRGCYKVVDSAAVKDFVKLGWEVRDARYEFNQKQDILVDSKDGKGLPTGVAVTIWRDWTPSERAQMGEIRDAGYRFTMGWMQMQRDIALGRMFKAIAENPELCSNLPGEGYSQVPDTEISETGGVKKYGALAGKYVRDDVLASIMPHAEVSSAFMRSYKKLLAYWKEGKTALNPVSHMNNCVGNIVMAHLAGVDMWNAKAYMDTILSIANHESWVSEAQKNGLYSGLFTREEIEEMLPEEFQKMLNSEKSAVARGADWVFTYVLNYGLRKGMRQMYEYEDKLFRLVIYKSALDRGLNPKEAVDYTLSFIPTYDDLPGGARAIRDTIIPFFAWTYKTIPTILLSAAKYPWRFAAVAVLLHTANALSYALGAGDDDDDWITRWQKGRKLAEAEEKLLPDYMRGYGAFANPKFIRVWTDETTGLPVYWNISNFVPGGQMFDVNNQAGGMPWPEMLNVSSPVYAAYCALFLNVDTFMGQPLTMDSDTGMEKAEKRAAYMWRQLAPAMAAGGYHYERIMNAMANATGDSVMGYTGVGRNGQAVTPLAAGLNTIGIKVRDVDFEQEMQRRVAGILAEQREIQANIKHMAKLLNKGAVTAESAEEYKLNQKEKMKRSADKLKEVQDADKQRKENTRY